MAGGLCRPIYRITQGAGLDVVVPQLLARPAFIDVLDDVATETGARFHELLLVAPAEETAQRFRARRAKMEASGRRHPQATANDDAASIAAIAEELGAIAKTRARTRVIQTEGSGPEASYAALCAALADGG